MSLEQALQENTVAIRELIAALTNHAPTPAPTKEVEAAAEKAVEKAKAKAPAKKTEPAVETAANRSSDADATSDAVTYSQVSDAVLKLVAAKGRAAATDILTDMGLKSAREAKPEQYAELLAKVAEVMGA